MYVEDEVDARRMPFPVPSAEGASPQNLALDLLDFFAVNGGLSGPYLETRCITGVVYVAGGDQDRRPAV